MGECNTRSVRDWGRKDTKEEIETGTNNKQVFISSAFLPAGTPVIVASVEGALEEVRCLLVVLCSCICWRVFPSSRRTHEKDDQDDDGGFYAAPKFRFSASFAVYISRGVSVIVMKKTLNLKRRYNLLRSFSRSHWRVHTLSRIVGSKLPDRQIVGNVGRQSGTRRKQEKWQRIYETIGSRNH